MEELYEVLGLTEDASEGQLVQAVKALKQKVDDKQNIVNGLMKQIENYEEQVNSIASGVAEARVKDLIRKVQSETGYYVGKEHMATLNRKAAQYLYASEDEQKNVWEDMKAHTLAYGAKLGMDEMINSLSGDREEGATDDDRRYAKAKRLVNAGKAETWEKALDIVMKEEEEAGDE
jgi:hypothetical protein